MKRLFLAALLALPAAAQQIERPKVSMEGWAQVAALSSLAATDYHSTQRGFSNHPNGREIGIAGSCGGKLCVGRYWALNGAVIGGAYAVNRYVLPKLPGRSRRVLSGMLWVFVGGRAVVVVNNYRIGGR